MILNYATVLNGSVVSQVFSIQNLEQGFCSGTILDSLFFLTLFGLFSDLPSEIFKNSSVQPV